MEEYKGWASTILGIILLIYFILPKDTVKKLPIHRISKEIFLNFTYS